MIHYDIEHNTPQWHNLKIGIASSSNLDKIITPTGKFSTQSEDYADLLISELILQESQQKFAPSYWMERGSMLEADAANMYEYEVGEPLQNGGVFMTDDQTFCASPDRRVGTNGLVEIKCPAPWVHVGYLQLTEIEPKYKPQVQGQLHASEREWVDWFSFHPDMQRARVRTYRDEPYIALIAEGLQKFEETMQSKMHKLISLGAVERFPERKPMLPIDTVATEMQQDETTNQGETP
jgi:hypothetical protein